MQAYDYVKDNGEIVTVHISMAQMREREDESGLITLDDGTKARRSWQGYQSTCPSNYPMNSDAMGVHPSQVKEARAADERLGVPIQYKKTGEAVYESASQRKKHCEAHGFYDRNGGYSDPQKRK